VTFFFDRLTDEHNLVSTHSKEATIGYLGVSFCFRMNFIKFDASKC